MLYTGILYPIGTMEFRIGNIDRFGASFVVASFAFDTCTVVVLVRLAGTWGGKRKSRPRS